MDVFIVRPFGIKQGIDFNNVEEQLILPAITALGLSGGAATTVIEAGNIRADMFNRLLMADLVIADITIHNANVFYELGIRHALRDRHTFLLRGQKGTEDSQTIKTDEIPFDLKTDRYATYSLANPANSLDNIINGIRATFQSKKQDSPVFYTLPLLQPQQTEQFLAVPSDFGEEEEAAKVKLAFHHKVGKLTLLAQEADWFPWRLPALRAIGDTLYKAKAFHSARQIWEKIKQWNENDIQANDRLSTIYQRLAEESISSEQEWLDLMLFSDQALGRLRKQHEELTPNQRAEMYSLSARNAKNRWLRSLQKTPDSEKRIKALQSHYLGEALKSYEDGFYENLHHYYTGINALALLVIQTSLADAYPAVWQENFDLLEEAKTALKTNKAKMSTLAISIQSALEACQRSLTRSGERDRWFEITKADLACLTQKNTKHIQRLYAEALFDAEPLYADAVRRQLKVYKQLNILEANYEAVLDQLPDQTSEVTLKHYILFTGHMIDSSSRAQPRFPAYAESQARLAIRTELEKLTQTTTISNLVGIAGGASGGDILFHEVCCELGIQSELFLFSPRDQFVAKSVQSAGKKWIMRFDKLYEQLPNQVLNTTVNLPNWLQSKPDYSIYERNNLWMLYSTLTNGGKYMTLLALWDSKDGDGGGGTAHMVQKAQENDAQVIIIKMSDVLEASRALEQ